MSLTDALLLDAYRDPREVWIALRTDGVKGTGTQGDPYNGSAISSVLNPPFTITSLTKGGPGGTTATAVTSQNHGFKTGDMVTITGVQVTYNPPGPAE